MKTFSILIFIVGATICGKLLLPVTDIALGAAQSPESGAASAAGASMEQQIVAKEREGLDALQTGDLERFGRLTAEDAILVDERGPATKAQVLRNVAGFRLSDYSMENVQFVAVSKDSGLITYKITEKGASHGRQFAAQVYVSSLWAKRGNEWVCLFSQETPIRQPS